MNVTKPYAVPVLLASASHLAAERQGERAPSASDPIHRHLSPSLSWGGADAAKPYKFIGFGDLHGPKTL